MLVGTYSPSDITMVLSNWIVTDYDKGSFIDIVQNEKNFRQVQGIRGKASSVHSRNKSGQINFRVMQTSQTNEVLSQIASLDDFQFTGKFTVTIKDTSGQSLYQFLDCRLEGHPDVTYSTSTNAREWTILYGQRYDYNVAGNKVAPLDILSDLF